MSTTRSSLTHTTTSEHTPARDHTSQEQPGEAEADPLPAEPSLGAAGLPEHPTSRVYRYASIVRRQRAHGNQYTRRMLMRRSDRVIAREDAPEKESRSGLTEDMINVKVDEALSYSGTVQVKKGTVEGAEGEMALIVAPKISMKATMELNPKIKLDNDNANITVGPIQTMLGSERIGVYKKNGKVVAEYMASNLHGVRDARPYKNSPDPKDKTVVTADAPFYDYKHTPRLSNKDQYAQVTFEDEPKWSLPIEFGGGRLAEIRGADRFVTSFGAKRDGTTVTKSPFSWQVDWSAQVADDVSVAKNEKGDPLSHGISVSDADKGIVVDSPDYAGKLQKELPPTYKFLTVEAAMTESGPSLWIALLSSRQFDPDSAKNIEEALRQKNPAFRFTVAVRKPATRGFFGGMGKDKLALFAHATKQSGLRGGMELGEGGSHTLTIPMLEFIDPAAITASSKLSVWVGGDAGAAILGDFIELSYPFSGSKSLTVSDADKHTGEYEVTVGF